MCGIVGAVSQRNVVPILIEGLRKLEYRGYDSAGIALMNGVMERVRSVGRVADLEARARALGADAPTGIAHTRWATHGGVTEVNAHPHASISPALEISVVHNGIIENHEALRARLKTLGYEFQSQTDTEVIAHLVHAYVTEGLDPVRRRCSRRCTSSTARTRSPRSATTSRTAWSARARARRCCSAWAAPAPGAARTFSPPTPRRCCR